MYIYVSYRAIHIDNFPNLVNKLSTILILRFNCIVLTIFLNNLVNRNQIWIEVTLFR